MSLEAWRIGDELTGSPDARGGGSEPRIVPPRCESAVDGDAPMLELRPERW